MIGKAESSRFFALQELNHPRRDSMRSLTIMACLAALILFIAPLSGESDEAEHATISDSIKSSQYWPSSACQNCHLHIYEQQSQSMHAKSFTNPVFQAQYFKELLPLAKTDPVLSKEAESCISCHAPAFYMTNKRPGSSKDQIDPDMSGVTCDFCHTISGYSGDNPGEGNYISAPSERKLGPFKFASDWHHVYSELQTKSEFCGICHNSVNHHGLEIKSTFTEWKNSSYAKEGIQCQDCHMNVQGFLTAGKPVFESGKAADVSLAHPKERAKIYTHRFPGARTSTQVVGALKVEIGVIEKAPSAGGDMAIEVSVDNVRTGHKMPSGSADLRLLYLDLSAHIGGRAVDISADSRPDSGGYDVTGGGAFDEDILGSDILKGKRIYRSIFVDKSGKQTFSSYNAVKIIFDNRLNAAEIRKETYHFKIPEDAKGSLSLTANLYYLPYPSLFAKQLGLPEPKKVEIASASLSVDLR